MCIVKVFLSVYEGNRVVYFRAYSRVCCSEC